MHTLQFCLLEHFKLLIIKEMKLILITGHLFLAPTFLFATFYLYPRLLRLPVCHFIYFDKSDFQSVVFSEFFTRAFAHCTSRFFLVENKIKLPVVTLKSVVISGFCCLFVLQVK